MTFLLTILIGTSGVLIISALFDTSITDTITAVWQGTTPAFNAGINSTGKQQPTNNANTNQTPPPGTGTFGTGLVPIQF